MGKRICRWLLTAMAMLALTMQPVFAAGDSGNPTVEWKYKILEDGTAEIIWSENYLEITGELVIPESIGIGGPKVTSIGE